MSRARLVGYITSLALDIVEIMCYYPHDQGLYSIAGLRPHYALWMMGYPLCTTHYPLWMMDDG
jgi:hypothetical protein